MIGSRPALTSTVLSDPVIRYQRNYSLVLFKAESLRFLIQEKFSERKGLQIYGSVSIETQQGSIILLSPPYFGETCEIICCYCCISHV